MRTGKNKQTVEIYGGGRRETESLRASGLLAARHLCWSPPLATALSSPAGSIETHVWARRLEDSRRVVWSTLLPNGSACECPLLHKNKAEPGRKTPAVSLSCHFLPPAGCLFQASRTGFWFLACQTYTCTCVHMLQADSRAKIRSPIHATYGHTEAQRLSGLFRSSHFLLGCDGSSGFISGSRDHTPYSTFSGLRVNGTLIIRPNCISLVSADLKLR